MIPKIPTIPPPGHKVVDEVLSVEVFGNEIVLDGVEGVLVALTPEAAIETGVQLINAGLRIDGEPDVPTPAATPR